MQCSPNIITNTLRDAISENNSLPKEFQSTQDRTPVSGEKYAAKDNLANGCLGQLLSDMIGGVAELLNSLVSLNHNSTLGEVASTLMTGNRLFYLVLLFVMIMLVRRLLVALFLL